jgi:iron complex outermembrane receptor protein
VNKEWGFGTLKLGGVYEWSGTDRFNELEDFTLGGPGDLGAYPDLNYPKSKYPLLPATTNAKTLENSAYQTWQAFVDFELHPIDRLTITPGFKFVHSEIEVNAADENVAASTPEVINGTTIAVSAFKNSPLIAHNTYTAPLYFGTINYKIRADLSVYGQIATSFLLPGLPNLYYQAANLQSLQPEKTISYQTGVVYSHGNLTGDADVYRVDATNLQASCTVDNQAATCNFGSARYTGVEGEVAYAFNFGATLFANGSLNTAKQLANAANPGAGIATANPAEELTNAPNSTFAIGNIYHSGPWAGTISYKLSGPMSPATTAARATAFRALTRWTPRRPMTSATSRSSCRPSTCWTSGRSPPSTARPFIPPRIAASMSSRLAVSSRRRCRPSSETYLRNRHCWAWPGNPAASPWERLGPRSFASRKLGMTMRGYEFNLFVMLGWSLRDLRG